MNNLKQRKYIGLLGILLLIVGVIGLVSYGRVDKYKGLVKVKNANINTKVLSSVGNTALTYSRGYDEVDYTLNYTLDPVDGLTKRNVVIKGSLDEVDSRFARFKDISGDNYSSVISNNGKEIEVTVNDVTLGVENSLVLKLIIENAPNNISIKPNISIKEATGTFTDINTETITVQTKSISGVVRDINHMSVSNVELSLYKNNTEIKRTYTNVDGSYTFTDLEDGTYEIRLEEEIYKLNNELVINLTGSAEAIDLEIEQVEPYNIQVKKYIEELDLVINGKANHYSYKDAEKVVQNVKNARTISGTIEYKIVVSNIGEKKGSVTKVVDFKGEGLSFDKNINAGWEEIDGKLLYRPIEDATLKGKEKREIKLILTINNTNEIKTYLNRVDANGEIFQNVAYLVNNKLIREERVVEGDVLSVPNLGIEGLDGWYTDKNYTNKYNFNNEVNKDLILYAKTDIRMCKVSFMDFGALYDEQDIICGEKATRPTNPSHIGYEFKEWDEGDEPFDFDNPVDNDTIVVSKYDLINYRITYNLDGGALEDGKTNPITYTIESPDITLNNPSKVGYDFIGWTGTGLSDKTLTVTIPHGSYGDREYTANYRIKRFTLTVDPNGGIYDGNTDVKNYTEDYGTIKTIEIPEKEGYKFVGWTLEGYGSITNKTPADEKKQSYTYGLGNGKITANYEAIVYNIVYKGLTNDEKTALNNPVTYTIESETIILNNPNNRYDSDNDLSEIFIGWTGSNGSNASTSVSIPHGSTGDKEYTANFVDADDDIYPITYDLKNGSLATGKTNPSTYTKNTETFTLNNPSKTGYSFDGWTGSNGLVPNTNVSVIKGTRGALHFDANYTAVPYTIEYENQCGVVDNPTSYNIETPTFTLNNPSKEGYTFTGWKTVDDDTKILSVSIPQGSTGNKKYIATCEPIVYNITYNLVGGQLASGKTNPSTYTIESPDITLNNPSKSHNTFTGWTGTGLSDKTITVTIPHGSTGDREYTANYNLITHNVTIIDKDPETTLETTYNEQVVTDGDKAIRPANDPIHTGYTFECYTLNNVCYDFDTPVTEDITLYSKYRKNSYKVTYMNESNKYFEENVLYKETAQGPGNNPSKAHNIFLYWSLDNVSYDFSTPVVQDITLYANYEEVEPPVISHTPTEWTNQNVTVTITNAGTVDKDYTGYSYMYKINNGTYRSYTGPFEVEENCTIYSYAIKNDVNSVEVTHPITNIDKIKPRIDSMEESSVTQNGFVITTQSYDNESGMARLIISIENVDSKEFTYTERLNDRKTNSYGFTGLEPDTTYRVRAVAYDVATNESEVFEKDVTTSSGQLHYVARIIGENNTPFLEQDYIYFTTLKSAIEYDDCVSNQCTIQMLENVTESNTILNGQDITLDLHEKTVTGVGDKTFDVFGNFTLTDDWSTAGGVINNTDTAISVNDGGSLTIGKDEGNVSSSRPYVYGENYGVKKNGGNLNFYDGKIEGNVAISGTVDRTPENFSTDVISKTEGGKTIQSATLKMLVDAEARIGNQYYTKLEYAIDDVPEGELSLNNDYNILKTSVPMNSYYFEYDENSGKLVSNNNTIDGTRYGNIAKSYIPLDLTNVTDKELYTENLKLNLHAGTHENRVWTDLSEEGNNADIYFSTWDDTKPALKLNGNDSYAKVGSLNYEKFTFEVTFELSTVKAETIMSNYNGGGCQIAINSRGRVVTGCYIDDEYMSKTSTTTLQPNTKYTVSMTYDGNQIKQYINGELTGTMNCYNLPIQYSDNNIPLILGATPSAGDAPSGSYMNGYIYGARVYSEALSADNIRNNYEYTSESGDNVTLTINATAGNGYSSIYLVENPYEELTNANIIKRTTDTGTADYTKTIKPGKKYYIIMNQDNQNVDSNTIDNAKLTINSISLSSDVALKSNYNVTLKDEPTTIQLLRNINATTSYEIPKTKNVVLDMNGYTITSTINNALLYNNGKLEITDTSGTSGHIINTTSSTIFNDKEASLKLDDIVLDLNSYHTNEYSGIDNYGDLDFSNSKIIVSRGVGVNNKVTGNLTGTPSFELNGGNTCLNINTNNPLDIDGYKFDLKTYGTGLIITGSTGDKSISNLVLSGDKGTFINSSGNNKITISDTVFPPVLDSTNSYAYYAVKNSGSDTIVNNCTINRELNNSGTIVINDSEFSENVRENKDGYYRFANVGNTGTMTINDSTLTSVNYDTYNVKNSGNLTVSGTTLNTNNRSILNSSNLVSNNNTINKYTDSEDTVVINSGNLVINGGSIIANENNSVAIDNQRNLMLDKNLTISNFKTGVNNRKTLVLGNDSVYASNTSNTVYNYEYTGSVESFVAPQQGRYKIELWGAQGGGNGGKGAYTSGYINLNENQELLINVGGTTDGKTGGYNGGGTAPANATSGYGGGGSTDVRLDSSVNSRIMVAAGGAGYGANNVGRTYGSQVVDNKLDGLDGGGLILDKQINTNANPVNTQQSGWYYSAYVSQTTGGNFGYASSSIGLSGAGGGYYSGVTNSNSVSSGGSSYISGHLGSVAITSASDITPRNNSVGDQCADLTSDITCSYHYSNMIFDNTNVISGTDAMATPNSTRNGFARITYISDGQTLENIVSQEYPKILATDVGIASSTTANLSFYDGLIRGSSNKAVTGSINTIPTSYELNIDNSDYQTITLSKSGDVAQIGSTKYSTLKQAVEAVPNNELTEIIILRDFDNRDHIDIGNTKKIKIDFNGHNVNSYNNDYFIKNNGELELFDSTNPTNKQISINEENAIVNNNKLTIKDITIKPINSTYSIENNGTFNLEGGVLSVNSGRLIKNNSIFNMSGGRLEDPTPTDSTIFIEKGNGSEEVNISGGEIFANSSSESAISKIKSSNKLNVTGGEFTNVNITHSDTDEIAIIRDAAFVNTSLSLINADMDNIISTSNSNAINFSNSSIVTINDCTFVGGKLSFSQTKNVSIDNTTAYSVSTNTNSKALYNETVLPENNSDFVFNFTNSDFSFMTLGTNSGYDGASYRYPLGTFIIDNCNITGTSSSIDSSYLLRVVDTQLVTITNSNINTNVHTSGMVIEKGLKESTTYPLGYKQLGSITIGTKGDLKQNGTINMSTEIPRIEGRDYGISSADSKSINFYDGIISGGSLALNKIYINDIETGFSVITDEEIVSGKESKYLGEKFIIINTTQNKKYTDIQPAIDETNPGDQLKMISNYLTIGDNSNTYLIDNSKSFTLDLDGHNIDSNFNVLFTNNGNFTIIDSAAYYDDHNEYHAGNILTANGQFIENNGTLIINDGNYGPTTVSNYIVNNGTIEINDGRFSANNNVINNNGILNVNNGVFTSTNGQTILNNQTGEVTISSGRFNGNVTNNNIFTMSNGHISCQKNNCLLNDENGNMIINGGSLESNPQSRINNMFNKGHVELDTVDASTFTMLNWGELEASETSMYQLINNNQATLDQVTYNGVNPINTSISTDYDISPLNPTTTITNSTISVSGNATPGIDVRNGGIVNISNTNINSNYVGINILDGGTVNLGLRDSSIDNDEIIYGAQNGVYNSGGTFNYYDSKIESNGNPIQGKVSDVETNTIIKEIVDDNKYINYLTNQKLYMNTTTNTEYYDLKTAMDEASTNDTIKVLDTVVTTYRDPAVTNGKNITLDLNGQLIKNTINYINVDNASGVLNIIDSVGTGNVHNYLDSFVINNGNLNVSSGTYDYNDSYTFVNNKKMNITGGVFKEQSINNNSGGTIIIDGGTLTSNNTNIIPRTIAVNNGTITIDDVTVDVYYLRKKSGTNPNVPYIDNKNMLTINDGTFNFVYDYSDDNNINSSSYLINNSRTLVINDGTFTVNRSTLVNSSYQVSAYGGVFSGPSGNIFYSSGTVGTYLKDLTIEGGVTFVTGSSATIIDCSMNTNSQELTGTATNNVSATITGGTYYVNNGFIIPYVSNPSTTKSLNINNVTVYANSQIASGCGTITNLNGTSNGTGITSDGRIPSANAPKPGVLTLENNTIIASNDALVAKTDLNVLSGTYKSTNGNGLSVSAGPVTLGTKNDVIDNTNPYIRGKNYGLYNTGKTINFYDGIIIGETNAVYGTISDYEEGYTLVTTNKVDENDIPIEEGIQGEIGYFEKMAMVNGINYDSLQAAVNACETGTTCDVIIFVNIRLTEPLFIAEGKDVKIYLHELQITPEEYVTNHDGTGSVELVEGVPDGFTGAIYKFLANITGTEISPRNIIINRMEDGSRLEADQTYKVYKLIDNSYKEVKFTENDIGNYTVGSGTDEIRTANSKIYINTIGIGQYKIVSSSGKELNFEISETSISSNIIENFKGPSNKKSSAVATLILMLQTGVVRKPYILMIFGVISVLLMLILVSKKTKKYGK